MQLTQMTMKMQNETAQCSCSAFPMNETEPTQDRSPATIQLFFLLKTMRRGQGMQREAAVGSDT